MTPRTKFVLLVLVFMLPTLASFIVFYFFPPDRTTNYGMLISPVVTLPEVDLVRLDSGKEPVVPGLRGKWLMITRDSGLCEAACRNKLQAMKQARLILGREQDRVLRVVLVDDDVSPSAALQNTYGGTVWIPANSLPWLSTLPAAPDDASGRSAIYAADPLGNIFMRYPAEPDIKRLSNDLQRVLKASQIG
ncbi:MAG: hypothetical protein ABI790_02810 [Betaproteobacteria bacterium]